MAPASSGGVRAISDLYRDYFQTMTPTGVLAEFLDASFDPEVQAPKLAEILEKNPLYAQYLQKLDILQEKIKSWRQDFPDEATTSRLTQLIIVLIRTRATRNTVLATWVKRKAESTVSQAGLPKKPDPKFFISPRQLLRCSHAASELFDEKGYSNPDLAYLAGFCFDWVLARMDQKGGPVKTEKKTVEELWSEGLKAAKLSYELAAIPKKLELSRYAFSATLLIHLGKGLMAASFPKAEGSDKPAWKDFVKATEAHGKRAPAAQQALEKRRFPVTHVELASLVTALFPMLRPCELTVRYYQEPYILRTSDRESYFLGAIISCALTLRRARTQATALALLSPTQRGWLRELDISDAAILSAMKRLER